MTYKEARDAAAKAIIHAPLSDYGAQLDAALSAFSAAGWELVPAKATRDIAFAGQFVERGIDDHDPSDSINLSAHSAGRRYTAMIQAALKERT